MTLTEFFQYIRKRRRYKPGYNTELRRDNTEFAAGIRLRYMLWCKGLSRALRRSKKRENK